MKAIAIVGSTAQSQTLLADLLHWHGLSVFQVDENEALLSLLSFISPELIIIEPSVATAELVCDRIKHSSLLDNVPVIVCADRMLGQGSADAYLYSPYTAEDVFANIQVLRPLSALLSDSVVGSAWGDV
ncbi:hypothetical protein SPB21_10550 [Leptothoe sp. ISB3NOV94-8A]|uniref:Response regulatory domain-containing protein n=1 Tax=Adonisia turfae CCMR0081 TaxID=2292702 RepID=A0A6M0RJC6_9CYAN|nr:hypothetical protein [Adonisia turfae]MDV3351986.1 hypothetical protein [Leptothoe sp. LEGE 181152]NEZ56378.1 hypothetical protein [Adonisia turfae CCMR0081]